MSDRQGHDNPFEDAYPLAPERVRGRDELCDQLLRLVRARRLAALTGPRRFGKTSVLGRVAWLSTQVDPNCPVVGVDCYGLASAEDFALRLARSMRESHGMVRRVLTKLADVGDLGLAVNPGVVPGIGLSGRVGGRKGGSDLALLHGLLEGLTKLSERQHGLLLVLDEFQDLGQVEGLDGLLRSHLQRARDVAVLFAGSQPSLLRQLFTDRLRPFYAQAELIDIDRFDDRQGAELVRDGFEATERDAGEIPEHLAVATQGHPQRLMMAAKVAWEQVPPERAGTDDDALAALVEARRRARHEVTAVIDGLDRTHRDTLRAVALYGSPYVSEVERSLGLKRGSAQSAERTLSANALLERTTEGGWRVVDPFLGAALRNLDREHSLDTLRQLQARDLDDGEPGLDR